MADLADMTVESYELVLKANLQQVLDRSRKAEEDRKHYHPVCEFCEENPVHVTHLGVYLRYCERCEEELK